MLCVSQVSLEALEKRHAQGWLHEMEPDLNRVIQRIREAKRTKEVSTCLLPPIFILGLQLKLAILRGLLNPCTTQENGQLSRDLNLGSPEYKA